MKVRCRFVFEYGSGGAAAEIERALKPDNEDFIVTKVRGSTVEAEAEADSVLSLLHTIDDFLACLSVAEKIRSGKARG